MSVCVHAYCYDDITLYFTLAMTSRKHNVIVWYTSVCLIGILTMSQQGATCNVATIHFSQIIRRTDIPVDCITYFYMTITTLQ